MKQFITILLCLFTLYAEAQVNTNDTNKYFKSYDYGFSYRRLQAREAFIMPTDTVINKLGAVSLNGAIYLGNGIKWTSIGGGGSSTDTTSLSNRINKKIDSLKRSSDSVYAFINGVKKFQYKDSTGTIPTLQQVTNAGATTTNTILVAGLNLGATGNSINLTATTDNLNIVNTGTSDNILEVKSGAQGYLKFGGGLGQYLKIYTTDANVDLTAPETSGIIPMSVNGYTANSAGAITIPTGGVAVDTIFRTLGKDSIFYKKNNITYAIKDSVGTNPAPVGYYGAFQDTTTQTAASINTAYPVNLRVTDLSNGITIANNSKIKIANAGIYNIQFSLQLEKIGGSGNMIADIWLRKNGVNIVGTTGKIVLTGSANASPVVAAWNYVIAVSSNDSLELMWATTNDNVVIKSIPATSPHPSIPSAILTVTQQSGIMAGTGISPLDTATMLSSYAKTNLVNTKLNISDTATMLSSYAKTNLVNTKLNISDTATMLSSYSTRINGKLNISDTSALQRKSIPAYSIMANNTSSTANVTAQQFRDTSGTYTGTITWTGTTAPSGATNHSYRLTQVGKCVTLHIALVFATNGVLNSAVQLTLPTGAPIPVQPSGLTGSIFNMYPIKIEIINAINQNILGSAARGFIRNNTNANGFEIFATFSNSAVGQVGIIAQYWTN